MPKMVLSFLNDSLYVNIIAHIHDVTGFPPVFLMYGIPPPSFVTDSSSSLISLEDARKLARERTIKHQEKKKATHDIKHHDPHFSPGDFVKRSIPPNHPSSHKLTPHFSGPFTIVSQPHPNTFVIRNPLTGQTSHENVSRLRFWVSSSPSPNPSAQPLDSKEGGRCDN